MSVTEAVISGPWPRIDGDFEAIGSVPAESAGRTLHLGFDVEGDPGPVLALLDALDLHRVGTTFFVQGQWAELHPELVREIVSRGHELANHAYGGELLGAASEERILEELTRTEQLVLDATGLSTKPYLRWPNGDASDDGVLIAADAGWRTIYWSGGADDFVSGADVDSMCSALLYHSRPGAILLAHTFHPDISEAVDRYLRQIQPYGYVVVPLSVLLADDPESMLERVD